MSVRAINTYTQTVTPALAKAWLEFKYSKQRGIRGPSVAMLAEAMRRGRFTTNTMKFALLRDGRYLINGQHTLSAIIQANVSLILPVQDFVVETEEDIAFLYYHEDTNRKRGFTDSVRAVDFEEKHGLTRTQIKQTAAALRWIKGNFGVDRDAMDSVQQDDLLEWIPLYSWEVYAMYRAISPCTSDVRNLVTKQAVLSVALITLRYAPEKAFEFWKQVARDDGLSQYDPRKTLRTYLATKTVRHRQDSLRLQGYAVSRAVALAWNAWSKNKDLRFILVRETTCPLDLYGCSVFNGNQSPNFLSISDSPNVARVPIIQSSSFYPAMAAIEA